MPDTALSIEGTTVSRMAAPSLVVFLMGKTDEKEDTASTVGWSVLGTDPQQGDTLPVAGRGLESEAGRPRKAFPRHTETAEPAGGRAALCYESSGE